ncbi:MAG: S-methyl-5-thioribose-1-phosphate isomerase [Thermoprotei archaeon]
MPRQKLDLTPVRWVGCALEVLDQRALPFDVKRIECSTVDDLVEAIKTLAVRGAPTLGVAGAYGVALSAYTHRKLPLRQSVEAVAFDAEKIRRARPTARNLSWGVERVLHVAGSANSSEEMFERALKEARAVEEEEIDLDRRLSENGAKLVAAANAVLTHCNTGRLATSGQGSALGVILEAHRLNPQLHVYATETRPLLQGARLTTLELINEGVQATLIVDSAAGYLMQTGKIGSVVVGADRILADGTTANKVGTYTLAVLAQKHNVPFYVAAPFSTFDLESTGITIEQRGADEVLKFMECRTAPPDVDVWNPAFDVTPPQLVSAFITEKGVLKPPYSESIPKAFGVEKP